jgi:L-threonylcarbamoyladenylate synthase
MAKELLLSGDVVAIPTETVYGLAGWIQSEIGLKKIFSTKERPFFDPLIVHVDNLEKAKSLSNHWTDIHDILAKACWPGPLTLIAKKAEWVNPLITSGLDSVGIRVPNHPKTLELLSQIPGGLAAPSANKFGKTSPTSTEHVFQEFANEVSIIDGGPSKIGIESTVAGVEGQEVKIYRPGFYTAKMIKEILMNHGHNVEVKYAESPVAPGHLKHHYMPKIPLVIAPEGFNWEKDKNKIESSLKKSFISPAIWKLERDASLASRYLYQHMREFDLKHYDLIIVFRENHHASEEWLGVWNRLYKAQSSIID